MFVLKALDRSLVHLHAYLNAFKYSQIVPEFGFKFNLK